jgi:hydrogenase-4 component B
MLHGFEIKSPSVLIVSILAVASLALVGTMALLCFTKAFNVVFLGLPRSEEANSVKNEVSPVMILSMSILALFILLIGLFPQYALYIVKNPAMVLLKTQPYAYDSAIPTNILQTISLACFGFILLFIFIYAFRTILLKNKSVYNYKTWDCGCQAGNNRMQYTAYSYASPFLAFLKPLFVREFDIKKPKGLFPKEAHFKLHIRDIFEFYLINPVIKTNKKFLERFYWIQSGSTQQYILYGLLFIIVALVGLIGVN